MHTRPPSLDNILPADLRETMDATLIDGLHRDLAAALQERLDAGDPVAEILEAVEEAAGGKTLLYRACEAYLERHAPVVIGTIEQEIAAAAARALDADMSL